MKKSSLLAAWGILYIICAVLGLIPAPEGSVRIFLMLISVLFFVPPGVMLVDALQSGDRQTVRLIRILSAASLGMTLVLIVISILTAFCAEWVGNLLHFALAMLSAPMFCSNYWVLSLFLWAMLLVGSFCRTGKQEHR